MRQSLRLIAKRMLDGTRGLLFIIGSLLLVTAIVEMFHLPQVSGINTDYWARFQERLKDLRFMPGELVIFADLFIALLTLAGGLLIFRWPLFFTLTPAVLLTGRVVWAAADSLMSNGIPDITLSLFLLLLVGVLIRTIFEARTYRREAALAMEYYRSTAILRQKEARR